MCLYCIILSASRSQHPVDLNQVLKLNTNFKVLFDFKTYTQNSVAGKPAMSQGQSMPVLQVSL